MTRKLIGLLGLALTLSACDSQPTPAPGAGAAANAVPAPAPMAEPAKPVAVTVVKFGPERAKAGQAFNVQADGNSGIWFELDAAAPAGTSIAGTFGGKPLVGPVVNGKFAAATIPLDYLEKPGTYPIELHVPATGPAIAVGSMIVE